MAVSVQILAANEWAWLAWSTAAAGSPVPAWLSARGLDPVAIRAAGYQLGWAADEWTSLTRLLDRHRITSSVAVEAGLVRLSGNGRSYDAFRDRIVLPVRDIVSGRPAGFIARSRTMSPDMPKYLNSPTNAVFRKGSHLFGAWEARQQLRRQTRPAEGLVVCEGPMDVLNVAATGGWAAVAPCGTAMTADQARWIIALANAHSLPVLLAYDADEAGQRASDRAWDLLVDCGATRLRLADLPDGSDPASLSAPALEAALTPPTRQYTR